MIVGWFRSGLTRHLYFVWCFLAQTSHWSPNKGDAAPAVLDLWQEDQSRNPEPLRRVRALRDAWIQRSKMTQGYDHNRWYTHIHAHTHIIYTHCVYAYYDILCSKCILVAKYCKIPCDMNSSNTNMLQIPWKMRGSNSKMLQNTVEMAAPSSKMLQTARETDRTGDQKKTSKAEHSHNSQNNFNSRPIYKYIDHFNTLFIIHATSDDYLVTLKTIETQCYHSFYTCVPHFYVFVSELRSPQNPMGSALQVAQQEFLDAEVRPVGQCHETTNILIDGWFMLVYTTDKKD